MVCVWSNARFDEIDKHTPMQRFENSGGHRQHRGELRGIEDWRTAYPMAGKHAQVFGALKIIEVLVLPY